MARSYRWFCLLLVSVLALQAQTPEWIWFDNKGAAPPDPEVRFFRKSFTIEGEVSKASFTVSGDDKVLVFLNGKQIGSNTSWDKAETFDVTRDTKSGLNVIAARGQNGGGDAAMIARLQVTLADGQKRTIVSDQTWVTSAKEVAGWTQVNFTADGWSQPISRGKLGVMPWGDVMNRVAAATPAEKLTVLQGFKVELLHSATKEEGSWICMAVDPKGRLIISPQGDKQPLLRATVTADGKLEKLEKIDQPVWAAMGLLYAFDSLYVSGNGSKGLGLYRLRDSDGDDQYDKLEFLRKIEGAGGEHGSHALVLGPDQKIYYIHGNFVKVPGDISKTSQHKHYAEDQLLPRQEDGNGFGVGLKPPGSFVLRMDPEAKDVELYAAGMRNAYDFDFNQAGEKFCFDSDMEWDWGTPWYRATRIYHVVSGGDYGFREGTGKFPEHYPDSLPPAVDIGIGSPTGVKFGTKAKFPPKYQKALFAMDWSYGRILAVHLSTAGATYSGTFEPFIVGKPLNVTDLEFGQDGAMYFTTGGRGTQSGLYRVTYRGAADSADAGRDDTRAAKARTLRQRLEAFHGKKDPEAIDFAWPHLNSDDRWIRYAARIAIESQPRVDWQPRALAERKVEGSLAALLALARAGPKEVQDELIEALIKLWPDELNEEQKLDWLRTLSLSFIRMSSPKEELHERLVELLNSHYPAQSFRLNHELAQVLIYLDAPGIVSKTLALLTAAPTQEEQLFYIFHLRNVKGGWTLDQRKIYFTWFNRDRSADQHSSEVVKWFADVGRTYSDGASFPKFMANIKKDAIKSLNDSERPALAPLLETTPVAATPAVKRGFVKEWTMSDLTPLLDQVGKGRSYQKGRAAFIDAQCLACHRFGNEGGAVGPDITGASSRFNRRDLLETIIEPSKVVSDQYQNLVITKKDGDDVTGRLLEETEKALFVRVNPLSNERIEVLKKEVASRVPSKVSPMPEATVNILTKEEILDLLAYIESGGNPNHAVFAKK